jgi:hypothetical protein
MPEVAVERRGAPRYPMVLAAEVVELPRGARLSARTSDISISGCYLDTLDPVQMGARIRVRFTHHDEQFEAIAIVVYVSPNLGMGVRFSEVAPEQQTKLERWLNNPDVRILSRFFRKPSLPPYNCRKIARSSTGGYPCRFVGP